MTQSRGRRALLILALIALVITLIYTTMRAYMGQVLARQFNELAAELAENPLLSTAELSYAPGIYAGTLTVRLAIDPSAELTRDQAALMPLLAAWPGPDAALRGEADVLQGPVWRSDYGWIWALLTGSAGSPETLADTLPDLAEAPLLQWQLRLQAGGIFSGSASLAGYDGRLAGGDQSIRWSPSTIDLRVGNRPNTMALRLTGTDIGLSSPGSETDVTGLSGQVAVVGQRQLSLEMAADRIRWEAETGTRPRHIEQVQLSSSFYADESTPLGHELRIMTGPGEFEILGIDDSRFEASLSDLDPARYADTLQALGSLVPPAAPGARQGALRSVAELLAEGASVRLGPLAMSLSEPDDVTAQLAVSASDEDAEAGTAAGRTSPAELLRRAEFELEVEATLGAIRRYTRLLAEHEARLLARDRGLDRTEEEIARSAASRYRTTLLSLQFMPLVTVGDGTASTSLSLRDQTVYRNDEELMSLEQLLNLLPG